MRLFDVFKPSLPSPDLNRRLEQALERLLELELRFNGMRQEWEIVTAHVDQQTSKVHRELGHVTKRKADLERHEPCADEETVRRSRFRGGRGR